MTKIFPLDQQANDRLLLEQEQRKQDLINQAVRRFAPQLINKPNIKLIHLYSTNASLRKTIRGFGNMKTLIVEHCKSTGGLERKGVNEIHHDDEYYIPLPKTADLVVTKSGLTSKTEWLAARLGAMAVVLPEGEDYLLARLDRQQVLILVGADQAK